MVTIITNNDIEHDTNNNNTNNVYNNSNISRYKRLNDGIGYGVVRLVGISVTWIYFFGILEKAVIDILVLV